MFPNNIVSIKFSGDGTNINRTRKNLLNFTFTVIQDKNAKSVEGNFILGK